MVGFAALAALAGTQCGYPEFMFGSTTSTGGGAGGTGGIDPSTSTSSGAGGDGGPKPCRLLHDVEDCGAKMRCTIVDDNTGQTGCVNLAQVPLPAYSRCDDDKGCPQGTWCDQRTFACMPFCATANDCLPGFCVAARNASDLTIPGASVCTAHCDPVAATPCGVNATCTYDANVADFDCFLSHNKVDGAACSALNDCAKGLVCAGNLCSKWCHPAGNLNDPTCTSGICDMFSDILPKYNGDVYGYCY
jgi:hypothetical protein